MVYKSLDEPFQRNYVRMSADTYSVRELARPVTFKSLTVGFCRDRPTSFRIQPNVNIIRETH